MILKIIFCVIGSLAFAVTMKVPKKSILFVAVGAFISAAVENLLTDFYGNFVACLAAMVCLSFYCELTARILKQPTTVILMPSAIPLLPGSAIYYAMFYAIQSNTGLFTHYAKITLFTGLGIALGAIISSTLVKVINYYREI